MIFQSSSFVSCNEEPAKMPPLFTTISIFPNACNVFDTKLSRSLLFVRSPAIGRICPSISFAANSSLFLLLPKIATTAPSSENRLAHAKPIPDPPPVIMADLPFSLTQSPWAIDMNYLNSYNECDSIIIKFKVSQKHNNSFFIKNTIRTYLTN